MYCSDECEVRAVEVDCALENTDDDAVEALDPDETVEALEFVLESGVVGESDRSEARVDGRLHGHFRDGSGGDTLRTDTGSSLTSDIGAGLATGRRGIVLC